MDFNFYGVANIQSSKNPLMSFRFHNKKNSLPLTVQTNVKKQMKYPIQSINKKQAQFNQQQNGFFIENSVSKSYQRNVSQSTKSMNYQDKVSRGSRKRYVNNPLYNVQKIEKRYKSKDIIPRQQENIQNISNTTHSNPNNNITHKESQMNVKKYQGGRQGRRSISRRIQIQKKQQQIDEFLQNSQVQRNFIQKKQNVPQKFNSQKNQNFIKSFLNKISNFRLDFNTNMYQKCNCEVIRINKHFCHQIYQIMKNYEDFNSSKILQKYQQIQKVCFQEKETIIQIEKDIKRTFNVNQNQNQLQKLKQILICVSMYNNIGYVQGMSFIAAGIMQHCEEPYTYYLVIKLFQAVDAKINYDKQLEGFLKKAQEFYQYLKIQDLQIYENLEQKQIPKDAIALEWFITLGFNIVPLEYNIQLLQIILNLKWQGMFRILYNFLKYTYPIYKDEDFGQTLLILKRNVDINLNWDIILDIN